jgi:hypothetical protein
VVPNPRFASGGSRAKRRIAGLAILLALAAMLGACSISISTGENAEKGDGANSKSNTPRIRSTARELHRGLVTNDELKGVKGLPRLAAVPTQDAPVFENPDPRGFCGVPLDQPDLSKGETVVFATDEMTVFESIVRLDEPSARAFLDAAIADTRSGCPPYESTTNTGARQTVTPRNVVDLPQLADQRTAGIASIAVSRQTLYVGQLLLRHDDLVALAVTFSARPVQARTIQHLADAVSTALARLP